MTGAIDDLFMPTILSSSLIIIFKEKSFEFTMKNQKIQFHKIEVKDESGSWLLFCLSKPA